MITAVVLLQLAPTLAAFAPAAQEQEPYLGAPVFYESATRTDAVARFVDSIRAGDAAARWDERRGWLPAALEALDVPVESQVLVFSKTSLQSDRISPTTPRALYFGDEVVIGWIPGSPTMELTAFDPVQGPTFYAVTQDPAVFLPERRDDSCLACHASPRTQGWPGHLVRSVHPDGRGFPVLGAGTFRTTHTSPLEERWGGWYVTGTHGAQRHMGNVVLREGESRVDVERGANVTDLRAYFDVDRYPTPHSDIVALVVLEHQCEAQNVLARASYEARVAQDYQRVLNEALGEPASHVSDSTRRRLQRAAEDVVDVLLLKGEAPLTAPLRGTSGFAERYAAGGMRDEHGRSLRDLDLERRLYSLGCSPMIASRAFQSLPSALLAVVWRDLGAILDSEDDARPMPHLSREDRKVLRAHLEAIGVRRPQ